MDEQIVFPQPPIVEQPILENTGEGNPKKKKIIILAISIFVVLIVIIVSLVFFMYKFGKEKTPSSIPAKEIKTTPMQVVVEEYEMTLVFNEPQNIPNSEKKIELIELDVPGGNCFDCISSTGISIIDGLDVTEFYYSCGGITGECETEKESQGYSVKLLKAINSDSIRINIRKI